MSSIVECLDGLQTQLQSIAEFKSKVQIVYNPEELVRILKGTASPYVGIVYEGMTGMEEPQSQTSRGLGANAVFGLYLIVDSVTIANVTSEKATSLGLLSKMRAKLVNQKSPAGHFYKFLAESYAESPANKALWIQRWSTKLMLPT
jgi:hypothetical protein